MNKLKLGASPSFCKPKIAYFEMDSNGTRSLLILDMKVIHPNMKLHNTPLTPYDIPNFTKAHCLGASRLESLLW